MTNQDKKEERKALKNKIKHLYNLAWAIQSVPEDHSDVIDHLTDCLNKDRDDLINLLYSL